MRAQGAPRGNPPPLSPRREPGGSEAGDEKPLEKPTGGWSMRQIVMVVIVLASAGCSGSGNGGATGAAPERYMGERANVNGT